MFKFYLFCSKISKGSEIFHILKTNFIWNFKFDTTKKIQKKKCRKDAKKNGRKGGRERQERFQGRQNV